MSDESVNETPEGGEPNLCETIPPRLIEYLKGEFNIPTRKRIEEHLERCDQCRKELEAASRVLAITDAASGPAVDRAVDELLSEAVRQKSSDIHIEPYRDGLRIRLRVDGLMVPYPDLPAPLQSAVFQRLKLRAGMDLTETHLPQQGRFHLEAEGQTYELRAGTLLMKFGERMTVRILRQFGLPSHELERMTGYEKWLAQPNGLILVSGPTGSGKHTTLHTLLQAVASPEVNAMSVGTWLPFDIENVNHLDLMGMGGMTFAEGVRTVMATQDPDLLLIEDLRDVETANEAVEVALTGHLVLASIHAVNGVAAVRRLVELGVDVDSLAEALVAVSSQRLVRKTCPDCEKEVVAGDPRALEKLGLAPDTPVTRGKGCEACGGRGLKPRLGLYSLFDFTDGRLRRFPANSTRESLLSQVQSSEGKTLRESAAEAVKLGLTTPEEVLRVIEAAR